ncbi:glycosyltransferase family 4 protein [Candidatus Chloroploca asiatica]|uniref:Glycosyl transferase family 1 n=1 Tax=Candidatus Chloroploca asiatica TaxID=1506545 RepID=A0A2H3KKA5_9CHLR|nr:glycosyltransferase family 4 protein [Candidatus Chloroploca asiatica]PDV97623.1 glycosyl transferase family 1 [Candidatus Chloroploca asiatica]
MTNQVLLTVAGTIPADLVDQIERGQRPRADYLELAHHCGADLLDYPQAHQETGLFGRFLARLGGADLTLAWACFRRRHSYQAIITDGEQVGLPLAALFKFLAFGKRPQHLMITHVISVQKKMFFLDVLRVQSHIDRFLVYATRQKHFIEQRWKLAPERVLFTPFMVDSRFFALEHVEPAHLARPQICAVGLERRDYPTLLQAVDGLPVDVVIAAASPWSKRQDSTAGQRIPANVTVRRFTQYELRQLYADSAFLVMPLEPVEFQAGITAILEAMAMQRAVICSRVAGQTDAIRDQEHGLYVPPGDPVALRRAIETLLANPDQAATMGRNGYLLVRQAMNLDQYAERLHGFVQATLVRSAHTPSSSA